MSNSLSFKCPHCGTAYRVVPVQGMAATDAEVNCLVLHTIVLIASGSSN